MMPAPRTVAIPLGAFALDVLPVMRLSLIIGAVPLGNDTTAASAPALPFGAVTVVVLPAMRVPVIMVPQSASSVLPLGPLSLDETFAISVLPAILLFVILTARRRKRTGRRRRRTPGLPECRP